MSRAVSLPHEHGGYLTIAGATAIGVALSPARGPALAVGAAVAAAFFARAPIEQMRRGRGARLDGVTVAALAAVVLLAALALGGVWAAVALVVASLIVSGSAVARNERWHRATWFETIGMAALGASAGLVALAGGVELGRAAAIAIVIAVHTALAVPLVRSEVRPRERAHIRQAAWIALGALTLCAIVLALVGGGRFAIALAPRTLHALARTQSPASPSHPNVVGVRETVMLALTVALLIIASSQS